MSKDQPAAAALSPLVHSRGGTVSLNRINQFLLAFYVSHLALAKFITSLIPVDSFIILAVPSAVIVFVSLILNFRNKQFNWRPLIIVAVSLILFAATILFSSTTAVYSYAYTFIIYGIIPLVLLTRVSQFDLFFKYFAYFSVAAVVLLGFDPLNDYALTKDYMEYGYFVMLPAFASLYIARKYYKKPWLIPFEILSLLLIILYANRGAALAALLLIIGSNILVDKVTTKKKLLLFAVAAASIITIANLKPILEFGISVAESNGQQSYTFEKMLGTIDGTEDGLSNRAELWSSIDGLYQISPVFGNGIGAYESAHGTYTHNLFLEILVSFGILGILALIFYILFLLYGLLTLKNRGLKLARWLALTIGIVPLLFSMHPFLWYPFWIFALNPNIPIRLPESLKSTSMRGAKK